MYHASLTAVIDIVYVLQQNIQLGIVIAQKRQVTPLQQCNKGEVSCNVR